MAHPSRVLLGTVAIEPNRWGRYSPDRAPMTSLADHLDRIQRSGFDGIELWEGHLTVDVIDHPIAIDVFNSYVSFDEADDRDRSAVADAVGRTGARGVKFNVGNDPSAERAYVERLGRWLDALPPDSAAICECHDGISIAEDPVVAARLLAAAGPAERVQALVHTHDGVEVVQRKLDALGERITHVHVNHLDFSTGTHPPLADVEDELAEVVETLHAAGFTGTWTLEFVAGLNTDHDEPGALLDQAAADLTVLRRVLA